ncbi:O-Antigen ligase [bacterium BMS3Abin15]|nr:O-Antigen ligase [bacterium BMS3Abin15]HDZ85885.1 hypothetical protein [Candidatus Moranbacteria bacterium]
MNITKKTTLNTEGVSAIFIIAFVSLFVLAGFIVGFNLPLFVITMLLGGFIAFIYPRSGLYAIVFLTFIYERFFTLQPIIMGRVEYKLYPLDIVFLAVIAGILFQTVSGKIELRLKKVDYYLVGFIFLTIIYFLISVFIIKSDFALSFSSFKNYVFYSLFYFVALFLLQKREHLIQLLKFTLAGATGIIFFIIYGILSGSGLWSEFTPLSTEGVRLLAFTHSFYLSMALLGVLAYLVFKRNISSKFYLALITIWVIGIVGSMMRHLWISLFISFIILYFVISKRHRIIFRKILVKYIVLIIAIIVILTQISLLVPRSEISQTAVSVKNIILQRFGSLSHVSTDESFSWRSGVWKEGVKEYRKNPLMGVGFGKKIHVEIGKYKDSIDIRNIHNSPLGLLVQMGILPFVLFVVLVYKNLKELLVRIKDDWIGVLLLVLMVNYLIAFLFQPYLEANLLGIFFWIILGLIRAYNLQSYENTGNK